MLTTESQALELFVYDRLSHRFCSCLSTANFFNCLSMTGSGVVCLRPIESQSLEFFVYDRLSPKLWSFLSTTDLVTSSGVFRLRLTESPVLQLFVYGRPNSQRVLVPSYRCGYAIRISGVFLHAHQVITTATTASTAVVTVMRRLWLSS